MSGSHESHEKVKRRRANSAIEETSKPGIEKHLEKQNVETHFEKKQVVTMKPDEEEDSWMMLLDLGGKPRTLPAEVHPSFCTGCHKPAEPDPKRFKTPAEHEEWLESLIE